MYCIIFSVGGKSWKVSVCPFYLCVSSQVNPNGPKGSSWADVWAPSPILVDMPCLNRLPLNLWYLLDLQSTAYMYLYLEGEKVGLEIFLMQFQYVKLDITKHLVDVSLLY